MILWSYDHRTSYSLEAEGPFCFYRLKSLGLSIMEDGSLGPPFSHPSMAGELIRGNCASSVQEYLGSSPSICRVRAQLARRHLSLGKESFPPSPLTLVCRLRLKKKIWSYDHIILRSYVYQYDQILIRIHFGSRNFVHRTLPPLWTRFVGSKCIKVFVLGFELIYSK